MWEALSGGVHPAAKYAVLLGVFVVCNVAAHASAKPAPALFKLTVVATAHAEWDHTGAPAPAGGCERTVRSEGFRDVRFRTAKPTLIRVVGGRVLAATVRGLTGTVVLAGANTVGDVCGGETKQAIQDCATTRRSFGGATMGVLSTRPGSVTLRPVRNVRLRTATCPQEPAEIGRAPLGPIPGPLRISTAALANKRVSRLTLTGSASRRVGYGPVEQGTLKHRSAWKLTLVRVQP
jgi:hypothetical protein